MSEDLTPYGPEVPLNGRNPGVGPAQEHQPAAGYQMPFEIMDEPETSELRLGRYMAAIARHKWLILLMTVIGAGVGVGATTVVEPVYQARTTVWIETAPPDGPDRGPIRPAELLQSSSWVELLRSSIVMEPVVRDLELFLEPDHPADSVLLGGLHFGDRFAVGAYRLRTQPSDRTYTLETESDNVVERGSFGDSVGAALGFQWKPELTRFPVDRSVDFSVRSPRDVANELASDVTAALDRNGNFLRLTLRGEDPEQLAEILNELAEQYIAVAADLKRARLDELVEILGGQVQYAADQLRSAEMALEDFRVKTVTLPSERSTPVAPGLQITRDPVFSDFFGMQLELEDIRRQQDMIQQSLESGAGIEALRVVQAVQQSAEMGSALDELTLKRAELRALRYRYTDDHPPVQQLLEEIRVLEEATLPTLGRRLLAELGARERQLEGRIASASEELEQIPPRTIEETRLARSVASADNLYTTLLRRYEEARLSAASSVPDVRILDRAVVPQEPVGNQKPQLILLATLLGLGLGVAGALLRDRLDKRLFYPDQVTDELGLRILAGIPRIRTAGWGRSDNRLQAQEAFRTLRLNLMHAFGSAGPLTVTVTSPGPGDGKSLVVANLGRAFADIGKRTLLIDGDTRRGTLHDVLSVDRKPGLIDLLHNDKMQVNGLPIRKTRHEGLFLLPSGSRVHESPELLSSRAMRDLVLRLRSDFDVILVDSPPLGAGVDPFVLGTLTGAVLLVLRTGETDRELADANLEIMDRLPIRLLGAVLNGIPANREYRYYSYTSGYATTAEEEAESSPLLQSR